MKVCVCVCVPLLVVHAVTSDNLAVESVSVRVFMWLSDPKVILVQIDTHREKPVPLLHIDSRVCDSGRDRPTH